MNEKSLLQQLKYTHCTDLLLNSFKLTLIDIIKIIRKTILLFQSKLISNVTINYFVTIQIFFKQLIEE